MAIDPCVYESLPFLVGGARQLEDVAVELDPDPSLRVGAEPATDGVHQRRERVRVSGEPDDQRTGDERLDRARPIGCGAGGSTLHGVDVELEQLGAEAASKSFELVLVGARS